MIMERRPLDEYVNGALRRRSNVPGPNEAAQMEYTAWMRQWQLWYQWYHYHQASIQQYVEALEESRALIEALTPRVQRRRRYST